MINFTMYIVNVTVIISFNVKISCNEIFPLNFNSNSLMYYFRRPSYTKSILMFSLLYIKYERVMESDFQYFYLEQYIRSEV